MEKDLTFSAALVRLVAGDEIKRAGSEMHLSREADTLYLVEPNGDKTEYVAKSDDLLAEDWEVSKEAE